MHRTKSQRSALARRSRSATDPRKGFTLIEILISLSIMAILATVGTVNFLGYRNQNRLRLAADEMGSLLRTTQNRAISGEEKNSWGVYFSNVAANSNYYTVFYGKTYPIGATTSSIKYLDSSLKFTQPTASNSTTTIFNQLTGTLSNSSPVTIQIALKSNTNASTTINVYKNGRVEY